MQSPRSRSCPVLRRRRVLVALPGLHQSPILERSIPLRTYETDDPHRSCNSREDVRGGEIGVMPGYLRNFSRKGSIVLAFLKRHRKQSRSATDNLGQTQSAVACSLAPGSPEANCMLRGDVLDSYIHTLLDHRGRWTSSRNVFLKNMLGSSVLPTKVNFIRFEHLCLGPTKCIS